MVKVGLLKVLKGVKLHQFFTRRMVLQLKWRFGTITAEIINTHQKTILLTDTLISFLSILLNRVRTDNHRLRKIFLLAVNNTLYSNTV